MTMAWYRILYDHAKTHQVSSVLKDALIADLVQRGHTPATGAGRESFEAIKAISDGGLDLGGSMFVDEPRLAIDVDGLVLHVPARDVSLLLCWARRLTARTFSNGADYYKHHGRWHALVLDPDQHRQMLAELEKLAPRADAIDEAFYSARLEHLKRRLNARTGLTPAADPIVSVSDVDDS